jgi:hypothetical protein
VKHIYNLLIEGNSKSKPGHRPEDPDALRNLASSITLVVMLIERNPETSVVRRLGIGEVCLKRWVEADRELKTIILV